MPHPKVLGFRARYFAVACGIFFIYNFENVIFHFWPLPEKLLDCPKKTIILPDSGGGAAAAPQLIRLCSGFNAGRIEA